MRTNAALKEEPIPPSRYLNRELSWLRFNERVLHEASDSHNPPFERLKFLAIFESNLDEFYMVRVSGLAEQHESGVVEVSPDGLGPGEQLRLIAEFVQPLRHAASDVFRKQVHPLLQKAGVTIREWNDLTDKQKTEMRRFFRREVFPLCTPLALLPAASVPFISNRSLNLVVELGDDSIETRLARVKVPTVVPRAVRLAGRKTEFVLLEDVIAHNLESLFPGVPILGSYQFRVIRDADVEIRELEAADLIATIEETLKLRRFGDPVLLQVQPEMPNRIREVLLRLHQLDEQDMLVIDGLLDMEVFWEIVKTNRPDLKYPPFLPYSCEALSQYTSLFETIASTDVLVHHPYDNFRSVEEFVASAARDPAVMGIKQTLYRVGAESPIVESLMAAAEEHKQVAAMVELKARFDESNNLVWARSLERAGVHVTYGFPEMKTHCKLCLVVRREAAGVKSYAHIGTGNYNPATARLYTDLGLFTADVDIAQDISELFNYLTGFSKQTKYRKLLVAPLNLREGIVERIYREVRHHKKSKKGRIIFKLNALVDPEAIDALYDASRAGVKIDLIVRGVCCLRPGVPGMSDHIRVLSIVGRFLEHSRCYYFANGGSPDVLIGSADLMRRNLDRRIEALVPVEQPDLVTHLRSFVLENYLRDTHNAWDLDSAGTYRRRKPKPGQEPFDSQAYFMANPSARIVLRDGPSTR